uniref:Glutaredoxin domain-containing protein n=1 Tax=Triticum urartu TaxID=4572 RepID=A0A8R7TSX3_TRIUA
MSLGRSRCTKRSPTAPAGYRRACSSPSRPRPRVRPARRVGSRLTDTVARGDGGEVVRRAVAESLVLVVGRRGCYLSHVVKRLLQGLGVNPAMHEVADEAELAAAVAGNAGGEAVVALLAVFVGGRNLGGLDRLMVVHISGELVPILKDAGALWL